MNGSDESLLERVRRRRQQKSKRARRTRNATPPTAPPTMAPVFDPPPELRPGSALSALDVPPVDEPPTPDTLAEGAGDDAVAVPVPLFPPDLGDVEFIQVSLPLPTRIKFDDPPVTYGPVSDMAKRYSVPSATLTCQS